MQSRWIIAPPEELNGGPISWSNICGAACIARLLLRKGFTTPEEVENYLRPRLPDSALVQRVVRITAWFIGGALLAMGVHWTAALLPTRPRLTWLSWPVAGVLFIAIELVTHVGLQLRGLPSFYNGRG